MSVPEHQQHEMKDLAICVPNYRGLVEAPHHACMLYLMHRIGNLGRNVYFFNQTHTVIHTARQVCVNSALANPDISHVLWVDDDMTFTPEQVLALEKELIDNDLDYVSALAFSNASPTKACIFGKLNDVAEGGVDDWWHILSDYPGCERQVYNAETKKYEVIHPEGPHRRFRVLATGFGMVLMTRRLLDGMRRDEHGEVIPNYQHFYSQDMRLPNEDVAFCFNARKKGFKIYCDSRVSIGHISKDRPIINEAHYNEQGDTPEYAGEMTRLHFEDDESVECSPQDRKSVV